MNRLPTDEQRDVISSPEPKLIVRASAGAGKTFVLVERYLWLIQEKGLRPHQILTITFTKKAAAEMKSRIVERLRGVGLFEAAQEAETGPIQTIHSFCERMLRENSIAANLDPDFEVLADSDQSRTRDKCVARAFSSADGAESAELVRKMAGKASFGRVSPHAQLEESVASALSAFRSSRLRLADLAELRDPASLEKRFRDEILEDQPAPVRFALSNQPSTLSLANQLKNAYKEAGEKAPPYLAGKWPDEENSTVFKDSAGLIQICYAAWAEYEVELRQQAAMDYASLESRAVDLLRNSSGVRARLKRQYRALMVDESQDVNPTQYELLDCLDTDFELFVGDEKQSIYAFRGADVRLFRQRSEARQPLPLSKNWRSTEGILEFVDDLFQDLWQEYPRMGKGSEFNFEDTEGPDYTGVEIWQLPDKDWTQTARFIGDVLGEGDEVGSVTVLVRSGRNAIELSHRLELAGIASRVVGGTEKFYVRLEIRDLANLLTALANPDDDFSHLAVLHGPAVELSIDAIAMISQTESVREALATFTPESEIDHEALQKFNDWFVPLAAQADRMSAFEVIGEIFGTTPFLASLAKRRGGDRMVANVRKLLMLASKKPELGPLEFAEQIRDIQRIAHGEGDAAIHDESGIAVTLMTIHKSKGLEFDTVVLGDTHGGSFARSKQVEIDSSLGLVAAKFGKEDSLFHRWLAQRRKDREQEEELRVLYVAMTRAAKRLCIIAHENARSSTSLASKIGKHVKALPRRPRNLRHRTSGEPERD